MLSKDALVEELMQTIRHGRSFGRRPPTDAIQARARDAVQTSLRTGWLFFDDMARTCGHAG